MNDDQHKQQSQPVSQSTSLSDHSSHAQQRPQSISITKEGEPVTVSAEQKEVADVQYTETEPVLEDRDLEKYMEVVRDEPHIHPDLKKAGLITVDHSSLDPKHKVQLPIPDEKVLEGLEQPISSSWRWLSEIALFMLGQAHLTLKRIHGHVVRVMKR